MPNSVDFCVSNRVPEDDGYEKAEWCADCETWMNWDGQFWTCPRCHAVIALDGADDDRADLMTQFGGGNDAS